MAVPIKSSIEEIYKEDGVFWWTGDIIKELGENQVLIVGTNPEGRHMWRM